MHRTTVLLADDHTIVAAWLATLLQGHFDLVGIVGDSRQLSKATRELWPHVIVTDILMRVPGVDSTAALVRYTLHLEPPGPLAR
jgi:DNA-binding NarL/FixJ family response regulator